MRQRCWWWSRPPKPLRHRELFKEAAGMSRAEIIRRFSTSLINLWR